MTLNDLGNIGELLGGIAVVVSLLYLAIQIRHSGQISRFEAHRSLSHDMASVLGNIAADPDLYRVWNVMTNHHERASDEDRERFGMLLYQIFTTFSDAERFGRMDRDLHTRYRQYLNRFLHFESVRSWWSRQGSHYSDQFRAIVDERLREIAAESDQ